MRFKKCRLLEKFSRRKRGDYELPEFELRRNFGYVLRRFRREDEVSEEEIRDVLAEMGKFLQRMN